MVVNYCNGLCGDYSRDGEKPFCWVDFSVPEDHKVETQLGTHKAMAWHAAYQIQDLDKTILRGEKPVEELTDAQGNEAAFSTTQQFLEGSLQKIIGQLKWQQRQGIYEQQQELFKIMASVIIALSLEEKRSEEINTNRPEPGRLEEDAEAAEPETPMPPPPQSPPPPQLLLPAKEVKHLPIEQVEVRRNQQKATRNGNLLVVMDEVSDCGDGAKEEAGRVDFWDKKDENEQQWWNELVLVQPLVEELQQPQKQQQPQLPGAAAPTPRPSPQAPLPRQQSVEAQQLPLLSPPEEVGGDKHEELMVSKNMMAKIGGVVACDGRKGMMGSMQIDNEKELLQQHRLFGAEVILV